MSMSFAVISLALWLFALAIPILVGVFVYRDAKTHHMPPLLWALVAALVPSFLGLIVYLLVRSNHPALRCPQCDAPVEERFTVCPQCGARLKAACPRCGGPVETGWKVCPHCAEPLDWSTQTVTPPVQARDKRTGKVILLVILIPIVLLVAMLVLFSVVPMGGASASHTAYYTEVELAKLSNELDIAEEMYELRQMAREDETFTYMFLNPDQENGVYYYLLYLPHADPWTASSGSENGILGSDFVVKYDTDPDSERGLFLGVAIFSTQWPEPKVWRDGDRMNIHVIQTDADIAQCVDYTGTNGAFSSENHYYGVHDHDPHHYE